MEMQVCDLDHAATSSKWYLQVWRPQRSQGRLSFSSLFRASSAFVETFDPKHLLT